jgi:hypothetical protein
MGRHPVYSSPPLFLAEPTLAYGVRSAEIVPEERWKLTSRLLEKAVAEEEGGEKPSKSTVVVTVVVA